jgi:dolichol-phosphate mannosyltransferase
MTSVSIIVPVFHNAASLPEVLRRFQAIAARNPEQFEFIFVDDGSRDGSFAVLEELARLDRRVRAIQLSRNFGSNAASSAGISFAQGDAVVAISADLQDPPELIDEMLVKWREGYKIVLAAREHREDPWLTSVTSDLFWKLFRRYAVSTMPKRGCDFCLIDRCVIHALRDTHEPNAGVGMILWTGYEPALIHYTRRARDVAHGRSMWNWSKKVTYLADSFVSFSHMPIRAASILGILLASVGIIYAGVVVVSKVVYGEPWAEGFPTLIVVVLICSGTQLLMTGIMGEYLVRTLEAARRRPPYVIEKVLGLHAPAAEQHDGGTPGEPLNRAVESPEPAQPGREPR